MQQDIVQQLQVSADFLKHITTLSTGSLVLLSVFLEKLSQQRHWRSLVVVALGGFSVSLIASTVAFTGLLHFLPTFTGKPELGDALWRHGALTTHLGFGVGIISLAAFAIRNLIATHKQDTTY